MILGNDSICKYIKIVNKHIKLYSKDIYNISKWSANISNSVELFGFTVNGKLNIIHITKSIKCLAQKSKV